MKIGILQTGHAPEMMVDALGDYDRIFTKLLNAHDLEAVAYPVVDMVFPSGAEAADGWLITGSKHGAYEPHAWIPSLEALIRDIHARRQPLVGICFGHQIIAQALGGKVEKFQGGWAVGRTEYETSAGTWAVNAWHQDQVTELPEGAEVLGSNTFCENAILSYGDHIWTIQPHPEFEPEFIAGLLEHRAPGLVPDAQIAQAQAQLERPNDNGAVRKHIADFFKKAAQ